MLVPLRDTKSPRVLGREKLLLLDPESPMVLVERGRRSFSHLIS